MKFAFSTVSCPAWDFEAIAARAKEYGYDGVEVRAFSNESILTAANVFLTDPAKVRRTFGDAGVEICCLASSIAMAQEADAHLTVLHVVEAPQITDEWRSVSSDITHVAEEIARVARERLADAVPSSVREWCTVDTRLEHGRSYREIIRVASEEHAGLIVLGAHSGGAIDRLFFGSTAQHVVRQAPCPVLSVRP